MPILVGFFGRGIARTLALAGTLATWATWAEVRREAALGSPPTGKPRDRTAGLLLRFPDNTFIL